MSSHEPTAALPSATPVPVLQRWTLASHDVDEQAQLLPSWEQAYVQLETGRFESRIDGVLLSDSLGLFRKATNRKLHKTFSTPDDTYAVALLTSASDGIRFQGCDANRGDALLLPPGHAYDIVCRGRFDVLVATLPMARLQPLWSDATQRGCALRPGIARASREFGALGMLLASMVDGSLAALPDVATNERILGNLLTDLEERLIVGLDADRTEAGTSEIPGSMAETALREARRILVDEALDVGAVPSVSELARRLGISVRLLHQVFRQRMGVAPRSYAQSLRLSHARADLRAARPGAVTVAEVAAKWGFWHLGRFASTYRATFGELPSQSLRH
ncbi:MAG TPA: helix-turn-helix transcriptional regulator [Methylibium sp.]|nr:helix-turn-helix transcriptional regulator [Methylibium sp.]